MADVQAFEQLITQLMAPENTIRNNAERTFQELKTTNPDTLATFLVHLVRSSSNEQVRAMSAVLFRKNVNKDDTGVWGVLLPTTKMGLKQELLAAVEQESSRPVRRKVCDTVADLAICISDTEPWQELLPFMFRCTKSPNVQHRESALNIFSQLASYIADTLKPYLQLLRDILRDGLNDSSSGEVRLASLRATSSFLSSLEGAELEPFQELLPLMLQTISDALNKQDEEAARNALEMLIEVVDSNPHFFRRQLNHMLAAMLTIIATKSLEDNTRQLGVEFLVALAEKAPSMVRKLPAFVQSLFPAAMNLMLEIDDDPDWHNGTDEDDKEYSNFDVGEECLDRLAMALGGKTILPVAFTIIPQFLQHSDWRYRQAGLMAISQIGEGCSKQIEQNLAAIVQMAISHFQDPHPRVRWAAINTVGQMSTDFGPDLQRDLHSQVLPALVAVMDDKMNPRVQSHAAAAVINFTEHATKEVLAPYLEGLLSKLLVLLRDGKKIVQEQAITAIASVADCASDAFLQYYDVFMPLFKQILMHATGKDNRLLRGKAMECISLVGNAVGKEKFSQDAKEVMDLLIKTQAVQLEPDDPQISYMLQAWARICGCLGSDFIPYLGVVMPPLLASAALKPDVAVADAENESELEGMETFQIGDKKIGIRTSVLEEKATACNMICCYVSWLKEGFFPYVDEVAKLMVPLLKFYYHDEVRSAAVACMPDLLRSAAKALQDSGNDKTYVKGLLDFIMGTMVEALKAEPDLEVLVAMLESTGECADVAGENCLDGSQLLQIVAALQEVIKESEERRQTRHSKKQEPDFDEEEEEALDEEHEKEEDLLDSLGQCVGYLFKTHKANFLPAFEQIMPYFLQLLSAQHTAVERRIALCVFDDMMEHTPGSCQPYLIHFLPAFVNYAAADEDSDVIQAAAFGLGLAGKLGGALFTPFCHDALNRLHAVVHRPDARNKDNGASTDNAISAIGKICAGQATSINVDQVLPVWLSYLPLHADQEEARLVYAYLCSLLEMNHPAILGPGNQNIPKVVAIFADALETDFVDEALTARMKNLLVQIRAGMPAAVLQAAWSALPLADREKLQKILS